MVIKSLAIAWVVLLGLGTATVSTAVNDPLLVRLESGMVSGTPGATVGVPVYKGIPFATPPVGSLRWRPPQPVAPWDGVRKAEFKLKVLLIHLVRHRGEKPTELAPAVPNLQAFGDDTLKAALRSSDAGSFCVGRATGPYPVGWTERLFSKAIVRRVDKALFRQYVH